MALAIFDLDNTLLGGDSDHLWGEFLCDQGYVDRATFRAKNDQFYADYQAGTLDITGYLEFVLASIKGRSIADIRGWHQDFMARYIEPLVLPQALACVDQHRAQGDQLLIITATSRFIAEPVAARYGITDLIASDAIITEGRYSGLPAPNPSFGAGKVLRLQQWLAEHPEQQGVKQYFYSDSHNDLPLLEQVDSPTAVDPDPKLAKIARQRGWLCLSFRT